jgi:hypothetical protein
MFLQLGDVCFVLTADASRRHELTAVTCLTARGNLSRSGGRAHRRRDDRRRGRQRGLQANTHK